MFHYISNCTYSGAIIIIFVNIEFILITNGSCLTINYSSHNDHIAKQWEFMTLFWRRKVISWKRLCCTLHPLFVLLMYIWKWTISSWWWSIKYQVPTRAIIAPKLSFNFQTVTYYCRVLRYPCYGRGNIVRAFVQSIRSHIVLE